ncbi:hypothetical protein [Dietzia sp. 179-F 9C3 NHS]|uniref:hypothetical protein n=1 Tax=Dietzia sp. 179-F 9C3 NHS TaxID=3374295 RepID=UPI0038792F2E
MDTTTRTRTIAAGALTAGLLGLSACSGGSDGEGDDAVNDAVTGADTGASIEATGGDDSYEERLTPVASIRNATDVRVEGDDAWVTVPTESTSATAMLDCLQLLPARQDGETLTVIYSDGVEELCEWPDDHTDEGGR